MAGPASPFEEKVFFNASHAYKSLYAVIGYFNAPENGEYEHIRLEAPAGGYLKVILKDGRVAGGLLIGEISQVWDLRRAIESGLEIDSATLSGIKASELSMALSGGVKLLF